jgi:D-alanine-D-alanine ligase
MTNAKPRVLVLMGGPDAEREVSLMSGAAVAAALRDSGRFEVDEREIDQPTVEEMRSPALQADVVFPALHGQWGEGGPLQEILEQIGVAYVGSGPKTSVLAMDKLATKMLAAHMGIATPPARQLMPEDDCDITPPLVLKPVDEGSSVDLWICRAGEEVDAARAALHAKRGRIMAEKYIAGRELTVGIVCDEALPLIEIIPAEEEGFYNYQAKYERNDTQYLVDPDVPEEIVLRCQEWAVRICRRLGCRDVARVDYLLDDSGPWLLEVNTMPGFTSHSLVPMAARKLGLEMPGLCGRMVEAALARSRRRVGVR